LLDQAMKLVGGEVIAGFEEGAEDGVALGRLFEADVLEMAVEDLLGFADHLPRDGGLVIDALLQHGVASQDTTGIENEIHFQAMAQCRRKPKGVDSGGGSDRVPVP